jgi:hypothetical protein
VSAATTLVARLATACFLLAATPSLAAETARAPKAPACGGAKPGAPKVEVTIATPEPRVADATRAEIRRRIGGSAAGQRHAGGGEAVTLGLTATQLAARADYELTKVTRRDGVECVALARIGAKLANEDVTVLVDRRYKPGSCERKAVLAHEMEHVRIGNEVLREWKGRARERLRAVADRWSGRWVPASDARRIDKEVSAAIADLVRRMEADSRRRNARIDTPASYREVQRRCRGW